MRTFDTNGKPLGNLHVGEGRQILWFNTNRVDDDERDSGICVISSGPNDSDIRIERIDIGTDGRERQILWSRPLPGGACRKSMEPIIAGDLVGDDNREWIVPAQDGTVCVFDGDGTPIDTFSLGKLPTDLAVYKDGAKRLLVATDAEGISAWNVVERKR